MGFPLFLFYIPHWTSFFLALLSIKPHLGVLITENKADLICWLYPSLCSRKCSLLTPTIFGFISSSATYWSIETTIRSTFGQFLSQF